MKAKNTFALVLALSLVFPFAFTACSNEDKPNQETLSADELNYEAFVVGSSLSASGVSYQTEMDIHKLEKTDSSIPQTVTLTIDGKTVTGTYSHSEKVFPNNFYRHIYYGETKIHKFYLDDSGRLLSFRWGPRSEFETENKKELTEEACLAIAKEFILNNVSDKINLDEYTYKVRKSDGLYTFVFEKYINSFATMDSAEVDVLKSGEVFSFFSTMFGKISAADMPKLDQDKITQTIEKKLDTIYQDVRGKYAAVKYEEPELSLILLDNGTPAIYCAVGVRFEDGKGGSIGELVSMIIT